MPKGRERLRHPFVTAAWATGGVLSCLLAVLVAVWSYEAVLGALEAARERKAGVIREQAAQHWPDAISVCWQMVAGQAKRDFGFDAVTVDELDDAHGKASSVDVLRRLSLSNAGEHLTGMMRVRAAAIALRRWKRQSSEGFQFVDVEVLDRSGLLRFSGTGTGFEVASSGFTVSSGIRFESSKSRERAYSFSFTYDPDPSATRCLDPLIIVGGE